MTDGRSHARRGSVDGDRPASVRTLVTVAVTVGVLLLLIGALVVASLASTTTRTAANRLDIGDGAQLAIRSTDADVRLIEGTSTDVVIRAEVTSGLRETTYELRRRGDEIEIVGRCMTWIAPRCGVVVTVAVPPRLPVLVATDSANVLADGLRDRVVTIATGSGDIRGRALELQEFSGRTGAGSIRTDFLSQPLGLKATTKSGDIEARIPDGDIGYAVQIRSESGTVTSALSSQADGRGLVRIVSESGNVLLRR